MKKENNPPGYSPKIFDEIKYLLFINWSIPYPRIRVGVYKTKDKKKVPMKINIKLDKIYFLCSFPSLYNSYKNHKIIPENENKKGRWVKKPTHDTIGIKIKYPKLYVRLYSQQA